MHRISGSSPRARGTDEGPHITGMRRRFIPASAGNSGHSVVEFKLDAVHPRERGEQTASPYVQAAAAGSSPRARGTDVIYRRGLKDTRFIPASAGNRATPDTRIHFCAVHPRERGEQSSCRSLTYQGYSIVKERTKFSLGSRRPVKRSVWQPEKS